MLKIQVWNNTLTVTGQGPRTSIALAQEVADFLSIRGFAYALTIQVEAEVSRDGADGTKDDPEADVP